MGATVENGHGTLPSISKAGDPGWLQGLRASAAEQFEQHGLPQRRDEDWKYTPIRSLEAIALGIAPAGTLGDISFPAALTEHADFDIGVANGALQTLSAPASGVELMPLAEGLKKYETDLRHHIESLALTGSANGFSAINTALLDQGVVIRIGAGVDAGTVLLRCMLSADGAPRMFSFRIFVLLAEGAKLRLVEQFESLADSAGGHNIIMHVGQEAGSGFEHVRVQNESADASLITTTAVSLERDSHYAYCGFDLGGGLVRHGLDVRLCGPDASTSISGAFVLDGRRHVDNHVKVDHASPGCASEQFFRGVLGGRSRGVFNGKALIREGADESRVRQSNANLLLSRFAEMDTKPELEIHADEVEASHGATVGQLDEDAIFYLRSRGLGEAGARLMLTGAFCRTVTEKLRDQALAGRISHLLDQALPQADEDI
jgi:Fe-S cluster assembly protein SufD